MAPHSSTLAWEIPWTEKPGRLQSMGSLGVGHDWATSLSLFTFMQGNGNPLQCSCLENPRDGGAWRAAIHGVTQNRTRLKRLSSSSSSIYCSIPAGAQCYLSEVLLCISVMISDVKHLFIRISSSHFLISKYITKVCNQKKIYVLVLGQTYVAEQRAQK